MDEAVGKFQGGVTTFQQQLDTLIASVHAERASLQDKAEQLQQERQAYEEEKQRVAQVHSLMCTCQPKVSMLDR